ncbi:MAG: flagellar hook protein FlgE [Deltaproteobacteria bacterium]|nr:flagellar hook protein FlgE [Deltaproteobacteria bacterium]
MPSIVNGLFAGRGGIQSHGTAIAVLADNISNSNTIAYKASRAEFSDLVAGNLGGGGAAGVGSGSQISGITEVFSQGTFEFTGRGLDTAIDGNGFFILNDNGARYYSRAGNFKIDEDGNLLNQNNLQVLGFPGNGAGGLEALNVRAVTQSNVATLNASIAGNLDASSPTAAAVPAVLPGSTATFAALASGSQFSTFVDVFDTLGAQHTMNIYFYKTGPGAWTSYAYVDGSELNAGVPGTAYQVASQTLTFDSSGQRTGAPAVDMVWNPPGGWLSGASGVGPNFVMDPMTQYSSTSTIASITQDGKGSGNVVSFSVEQDGTLFALLDNGQTSAIGTIALVTFSNPEGLRRNGNSLYTKSTQSGEPVVGVPASGQYGALESGAIELSTSDMAADFIKLISLQKGFQGSSRVITSIDDLLNEIVNLAR